MPQLISATLDRYRERRLPRPSGFADLAVEGDNVGPLTLDAAGDRRGVAAVAGPRRVLPADDRAYGFDPADQPESVQSVRRLDLAGDALLDTPISTTGLRATQTSGRWTWTVTDAPGRRFAIARTAAP